MKKKTISFVLLFLLAFNCIGAGVAMADISTDTNNNIDYAFNNTDGVSELSNSQMSEIQGEWWNVVAWVTVRIIVAYASNSLTSGDNIRPDYEYVP